MKFRTYDTLIIGAGAAGLFCALEAGKRGQKVLVLDHANKAGKKILMSGGGRCNFTNLNIENHHYLTQNPNFIHSALNRFQCWDFIHFLEQHRIRWHEEDHGQLFLDDKSKALQQLLLTQLEHHQVDLQLNTQVTQIKKDQLFHILSSQGNFQSQSLVIATGGLSIPTLGASDFGFHIGKQFGHQLIDYRASLVPFTWNSHDKSKQWPKLSGISCLVTVTTPQQDFTLPLLITHRGLSGPALLQASNYWHPGQPLSINWLPNLELTSVLHQLRQQSTHATLKHALNQHLPSRLIQQLCPEHLKNKSITQYSNQDIVELNQCFCHYHFAPGGTEGYRTAEVTLGGLDTHSISSKTMESHYCPNLYFIGEVLDVTGWLGGYNFQWAWSSAWCAGQVC